MALKAILDSVDGLADPIKSEYTEKDGKFYLSVDPVDGFALEDVTGLKNTLATVNTNYGKAEKELKKFGSSFDKDKGWQHSLDPVKAKTALEKFDEFSSFDPSKEADKIAEAKVKGITDQLVATHTNELSSRDERISGLTSTVNDLLIKQQATSELVAAKGDAELLMPHIERMTRVSEKDGKFFVEVMDKEGNVRIGDNKGAPMTISQLVEEMKSSATFGKAFEGDNKGGSGKLANSQGGGNPNGLKRSTMTAVQKHEYQEKHGAQEFLRLPK